MHGRFIKPYEIGSLLVVMLLSGTFFIKSLLAENQIVTGIASQVSCKPDRKKAEYSDVVVVLDDQYRFRNTIDKTCESIDIRIGDYLEIESEGQMFSQIRRNGDGLFDQAKLATRFSGGIVLSALFFIFVSGYLYTRLCLGNLKRLDE